MHAVPIKPSRIYYRRDQEKDKEHVVAMSPKSAAHPKLRPASPPKRPTGITTHRLASETLQDETFLSSFPLTEEDLEQGNESEQPLGKHRDEDGRAERAATAESDTTVFEMQAEAFSMQTAS